MSETVLGLPGVTTVLATSERTSLIGGLPPVAPRPTPFVIQTDSPEMLSELRVTTAGGLASVVWPTANLAIFIPFGLATPITVAKLWVVNGAAITGNIDMGIHRPDGSLVVSKGSTVQGTINLIQELDIADTLLVPGRYYLSLAADTGAGQRFQTQSFAVAGLGSTMGLLQQATAFPLASNANPATFATFAQTIVPFCGLITRALLA